jgi:chromosome segregation ATPase
MLTKSEYSTSTSSLNTVFSGSLADLNTKLSELCLTGKANAARPKPSTFKNRLRERINKNKSRITHLKKVIQVSKNDALTIHEMRKMLYHNEVLPLVTFVDHIKNTTDLALQSMQRELASKESQFVFVVSEQKFAKEESNYLTHCAKQQRLFTQNFYNVETRKYNKEVKHCDRLLKEGEDLMKTCKHKIDKKNAKLQNLESVIDQREQILSDKLNEINSLQALLTKDNDGPNTGMKSYVIEAKLKNTRSEVNRLRNDKLELEITEQEVKRELSGLKNRLNELNTRRLRGTNEVQKLERKVGDITSKMADDIGRRSLVSSNQQKLQKVLDSEIQQKETLLKQVTMRKRLVDTSKLKSFIDTKTMRPTDWNGIDENMSLVSENSALSNPKSVKSLQKTFVRSKTNNVSLINSNEEESKDSNYIDNVYEKQSDLSLNSFDAD